MSLLDPDYQSLGNPDKDLTASRVPLDLAHHDVPERHGFGKSLFVPNVVRDVGATAADLFVGKSPAPAREDHVHGPGTHGHSGYSPTGHGHGEYSLTSHGHAQQLEIDGRDIMTGPASGTFTSLTAGAITSQINFIMQGGTAVQATDGSGFTNIVYPSRFPFGVLTVIAVLGMIQPWHLVEHDSNYNQDYHQLRCYNASGSPVASTVIRINWLAIGW